MSFHMHSSQANMSQSVECSLWYASPHRVLLVFPAAKTPSFRHELRHASPGHKPAKLPAAKRFAATERYSRDPRSYAAILKLR